MSLQVNKESGVKYDPVFLKILEDIPGGVTVKTDRFPTTTKEIKKGALLNADATTAGLYNVIKTVKVTADAASGETILAVNSNHLFKIDEYLYTNLEHAEKIVAVTPNTIEIAAALATGGVATGAVLYETATVDTATALYDTDAILRDTIEVRKDGVATLLDNIFAGAVVRGTVDESELPYFVTDQSKTDLTARIRFA